MPRRCWKLLGLTFVFATGGACKSDDSSGDESGSSGGDTENTVGSGGSSVTTSASTSMSSSVTTSDPSTSSAGETSDSGDPEGFDDEFDDPATLSGWTRLHETEGDAAPYASLDIDETTSGHLTLVPRAGGWFGDFDGPFLYKMMSGDFVVEVWAAANRPGGSDGPPEMLYNSAGLMARDPNSGDGSENWIIHNVGRQSLEVGVASEGKTTRNSSSTLNLTPGTWSGSLRICRIGSDFILTRKLDDENAWRETNRYNRGDMPDNLQVGLMVNGWNSNGGEPDFGLTPDVVATFDYIRLWRPDGESSCLAD